MTEQQILGHRVMLVFCMLVDFLLGGFLLVYLVRCWKQKLITLATAYASKTFSREASPVAYWLTFVAYATIAGLCAGAFVRIVWELIQHGG